MRLLFTFSKAWRDVLTARTILFGKHLQKFLVRKWDEFYVEGSDERGSYILIFGTGIVAKYIKLSLNGIFQPAHFKPAHFEPSYFDGYNFPIWVAK